MHKKNVLLVLLGIVSTTLFFAGTGLCAPVGNPGGPVMLDGEFPTKFSLAVDVVTKRKLNSNSSTNAKFKGTFYLSKVSLYLKKRLDIYGIVGAYDGKVRNFTTQGYIVDSKAGAVVGLGVSYVFHEFEWRGGIVRMGMDAKYRQFKPDIDSVTQNRQTLDATQKHMSFKEWQAAFGLAYQRKNFIPYAGIKYSDMDASIKFTESSTEHSDKDLESDHKFGVFAGFDFLINDSVSLNIETRQLDEQAINAGLNVRF